MDIKAILVDGSLVVIEMQIARMAAFDKRVAYNLAKAYANQLQTGEDYPRLNPAIALTITDFILFKKDENVINRFVFKEETRNFKCLEEELRLIFVELPKFNKSLSELNSLTDKWIYFLKETSRFDEIPDNLGEVVEIQQALNIANQINLSEDELDIVERRGIALQDERGRITYAEEQGQKKGETRLIMRQLKKRFADIPIAASSQIENLAIEDLESLGEDFLDFDSLEDLSNWLEERSASS